MKIKQCSLFSGIGAFEKAAAKLGLDWEITSFCEIDKYASCAYAAIHGVSEDLNLGDVSKVDVKDIPDFNMLTWGFPCFVKDTNVLTTKGYKEIQHVDVGDEVVVNEGNYKVLNTSRVIKDTIYVKAQGILPTETTINHPYLVRTKDKHGAFSSPYWKDAGKLEKGDFITIPKIKDTKNYLYDLTDEELFILGRYVADGHTSKNYRDSENKPTNRQWHLVLSIGDSKVSALQSKIKDLHYTLCEHTKSTYRMIFSNKKLVEIAEQECGCGAINKRLSYNILSLPKEKLEIVLDGLMSGDGCFTANMYKLTTISKELAQALTLAIYKVYGTCGNIYFTERPKTTIIEGRTVNQHNTYSVTFNKQITNKVNYSIVDGELWLPIKKVTKANTNQFVHNLEVDDVHIYTANNAVVHNCQDISLAGKQAGIKIGTRSGLYYEGYRILKERLPKYSIIENVKNLTGKKHIDKFHMILNDFTELGYTNYWAVLNAKDFGVPQNRERVFIISILGDDYFEFPKGFESDIRLVDILENQVDEKYYIDEAKVNKLISRVKDNKLGSLPKSKNAQITHALSSREHRNSGWKDISPTLCARDYKDPKVIAEARRIGGLFDTDNSKHQAGAVWDKDGIAPTLDTMQGGYRQPSIVEHKKEETTPNEINQVGNIVDTGNWDNPQRGGVYDSDGVSPSLNCVGGGGLEPKIVVREATKKGYAIAEEGDSINISQPNSTTRRGRVGKQIANTLLTRTEQCVVESRGCAIRGRNPENPKSRKSGLPTEQMLEVNENPDISNCLTTVQKDSMVLESKQSLGRMGKQAAETYNDNSTKVGDTLNPFNKKVSGSGLSPTITTRPEGFKTAIIVVDEDKVTQSENKLQFVGGIGDKDWVGDNKENSRNYPQGNRVYDTDGIACSQTAQGGGVGSFTGLYLVKDEDKHNNVIIGGMQKNQAIKEDGVSTCLSASMGMGGSYVPMHNYTTDLRIRKLTPLECWRLMGFEDEDYYRAEKALNDKFYNGNDRSNSQLYKMAGNSIVVDVLMGIEYELLVNNLNKEKPTSVNFFDMT